MSHRTVRRLVLAVGSVGLVGLWITIVGDDLDVGALWLLASGVVAGLVSCLRVRLVGPHASGGADVPRVHRQRSVAGDLGWLVLGQVLFGLAFVVVAVVRGEDDGTVWVLPFALALLGGGAALLGCLAGILVVVPMVTLAGIAARRGSGPVRRADVLLCLLLPTITAFATLVSVAVDSDGPSRSFPTRSLPALLAGVDTGSAVVASRPLLWGARLALLLLVAEVGLLVRAQRADRDPG